MNYESLRYVAPPTMRLTCTRPGTSADYSIYLYDSPIKDDKVSSPTLLDFTLVGTDASFVRLERGDYIILNTVTYPNWFTGYITNEPQYTFLGKDVNGNAQWGYLYEATSDEYPLTLKPLGLLSPFLNSTQGDILKALINILMPGVYDVSNIQDGLRMARYVVNPTQTFADVTKAFGTAANYSFWGRNMALNFVPIDQQQSSLIVDYTDPLFTPDLLKLQSSKDPIINDAIVLGDIEPQGYFTEYFVGTGSTGDFVLAGTPFGVDSTVFIDEVFGSSTISTQVWSVYDVPANLLFPDQGFLNVLGGLDIGDLGIYLASVSLIPLEGNLHLVHGEYDFVNNATQGINGVIGGLWSGAPQMDTQGGYAGCFYGIEVSKSGTTTQIRPIAGGTVDGTQSVQIDFTKRYVIGTLVTAQKIFRSQQDWSYVGQDGSVGQFGGSAESDILTYTTYITAIDPSTGVVSATTKWVNPNITVTPEQVWAYYVAVASNNLHCSVTGITVNMPMQCSLELKAAGQPNYTHAVIGANELDVYDGQAPVATITTTLQGRTDKSSILGSPQYNPGAATLGFFYHVGANNGNTLPQAGDFIHLSYRNAGAAAGRVQSLSSIESEAAAWGDDGLRSSTRKDLTPMPRTSAECEAAAAALVSDFSYDHFDGTYTVYSPNYSTVSEPVSGTVLPFRNLPAYAFVQNPLPPQYDDNGNLIPALYIPNFTEVITEVKTTILSARPQEIFQHDITFSKTNHLATTLAQFAAQTDVFTPKDNVEVPIAVDITAIGSSYSDDVVSPTFTGFDRNNFYYQTNQTAPPNGGFEVRFSDTGWGAEDAKNLALRTSSQNFSLARNQRSRLVFVRSYDTRNQALWSNDFTNNIWQKIAGTTVVNQSELDPLDQRSTVSVLQIPAGAYVLQVTNVPCTGVSGVFTVSVKGSAGQSVNLQVGDTSGINANTQATFVLNGAWQRLSLPALANQSYQGVFLVEILNPGTQPLTLRATWASLEINRQSETVFCKTRDTPYGVTSRYSSMLRAMLPMVPPSPTATITAQDITNPIVNINLPDVAQDVWGVEIRDSDNATILYHSSLADVSYIGMWTKTQNTSRNLDFYVYTFNVIGDYSDSYRVTLTIPEPQVQDVYIDEPTKTLRWTNIDSIGALVEISIDSGVTQMTYNQLVAAQALPLPDSEFFYQRYFKVTGYDAIGISNATNTFAHLYLPVGVDELTADECISMAPPNSPSTEPVPPPDTFLRYGHGEDYNNAVWQNYVYNRVLRPDGL